MNPVEATPEQIQMWRDRDGLDVQPAILGGPAEAPDVTPCPTLVSAIIVERPDQEPAVGVVHHVAYKLDEIELTHLARGGTLWLTTWGGLPVHHLEVVEP